MKKIVSSLVIAATILCARPLHGDFITTNSSDKNVGGAASYAEDNARTISMLGWGVGLAAAIAIIAAVIHQSTGSSSHSTDDPSTS